MGLLDRDSSSILRRGILIERWVFTRSFSLNLLSNPPLEWNVVTEKVTKTAKRRGAVMEFEMSKMPLTPLKAFTWVGDLRRKLCVWVLGSVPSLVRIKSGCIWPALSLKPGIWGGKYSQPFAVNSYKVVFSNYYFQEFSEIVGAPKIQRLQMIQGRESVRKSERLFTGGSKERKKRKKIQCYAEIFKESAC